MAKSNFNITPTIFTLTLLISISISIPINSHEFSTKLSNNKLALKKDKVTHLHFYFHQIINGNNYTAVHVAKAPTSETSETFFGGVTLIDDPLTLGPGFNSKIVGRAQGIYASASSSGGISLCMAMNFVFFEGKYNGSVLSILGRNVVSDVVREMPIVGGSGVFRFARGYAQLKTHAFDPKTAYIVLEYDVYVIHY